MRFPPALGAFDEHGGVSKLLYLLLPTNQVGPLASRVVLPKACSRDSCEIGDSNLFVIFRRLGIRNIGRCWCGRCQGDFSMDRVVAEALGDIAFGLTKFEKNHPLQRSPFTLTSTSTLTDSSRQFHLYETLEYFALITRERAAPSNLISCSTNHQD